jgi:CRISPR-associated endonuclease Cas1
MQATGASAPLDPTDVAETVEGLRTLYARDAIDSSVCVADGFGLDISVERGHLEVVDGVGPYRRTRRYSRADRQLRRLVILGHSGALSLGALQWCDRMKVRVAVIDHDGRVLFTSADAGLDDARLRRQQCSAVGGEIALAIAIDLFRAKLRGQAALLAEVLEDDEAANTVLCFSVALDQACDLEQAIQLETAATRRYFDSWVDHPATSIRFAGQDRSRAEPRPAGPVNALAKYLYALGEIETRFALQSLGLDPDLGFLHADLTSRDSLAWDVLEAIRPDIERYLLDLLGATVFKRSDFAELENGRWTLGAPLTHKLAETASQWAAAIAPHAEAVANALAALGRQTESQMHPAQRAGSPPDRSLDVRGLCA